MSMESISGLFYRVKLFVVVILLQFGYAGMAIIAKFALNMGMSHYVLVAYRMAFATSIIAPFAIFIESPVLDQNLFYIGMMHTNASFATALYNIVPALAFVMAWICRLEQVNVRRLHCQAKILGSIVAVGGAILMSLLKGQDLNLPWTKGANHHDQSASAAAPKQDLIKGSLLIVAGILQVSIQLCKAPSRLYILCKGMAIIAKFALNMGMSHYVLVAYRMAFATSIIAPFAIFIERDSRPRMTFSIFLKASLLSLFDPVLDQNLFYIGMMHTNASFATALYNIVPALAFVMAWICRLEQVNVRRLHCQAKILGSIVAVGGAILMSLLKGQDLNLPWTKGANHHDQSASAAAPKQDLIKGSLLIVASCFCWSCFIILQVFTLRSYPAKLSLTALICFLGMIECAILALACESGKAAAWSIHMDAKLLASVYGGILSGASYYIMGVVVPERGPVFFSAFSPLATIIVAILGSLIFAEEMYLGRIVGAVIIVMGLYLVLWGKSRDQPASLPDSDIRAPSGQQMGTFTNSLRTSNQMNLSN
ncbi:hypothetical protein CJ030_MR3G014644 [Morella rubra]|uniref:EamA domain-containing protein n=1 Tax=Morella rubra TaxID=262757 RepID=A0A6A1W0U7_9ROSI|nr:hypothetical protein CJ030_MR3G014644 [Morella rubra]